MIHLVKWKIFESANKKVVSDFFQDLGWLLSMNLVHVKQLSVDENGRNELAKMQQTFSKPLINGKNIFELIKDLNSIYKDPKMTSALLNQSRELLMYVEPRLVEFVKEGEKKDYWLKKISELKERYKSIVS